MSVLDEVRDEMWRQLTKWGIQDHKSYTMYDVISQLGGVNMSNDICYQSKFLTDVKAAMGNVSYLDIFLEEVMEARDEAMFGDLENLQIELIQCAAVALSWVECIRRNNH